MVIGRIADGVWRGVEATQNKVSETLFEPVIRLGVTGLARSGKTVFITSLVANLLDRGRFPGLLAASEGRIEAAFLQPQPDDTVPRFEYESHIAQLMGDPPAWPESTRAVSELRISLRVRPSGLLAGLRAPRTVHIDIVDYPGEWLLDLGLLDQCYDDWSTKTIARIGARPQAAAYLEQAAAIDPTQPLEEPVAQALAETFTDYLHQARQSGYSDCTPGRFLLPGELAGSPVLTFAPLVGKGRDPRGSLRSEMARRFEAYKAQVVRPFFRDHFARLDRQVVLVDAQSAIHAGPQGVADLKSAMTDTLKAFKPGTNGFLARLLRGKRIEKILFAATKADHLHHTQHAKLANIMKALTRDAQDRAQFAGAKTNAMAIASLRTTTEAEMPHNGKTLGVVRGTLQDTGKEVAFYPGTLSQSPLDLLGPASEGATHWLDWDYQVMQFAPARMALKPGDGLPHIRLDQAAEFLLGDLL